MKTRTIITLRPYGKAAACRREDGLFGEAAGEIGLPRALLSFG